MLTAGIHPDIPIDHYIRDPAPEPSLSRGAAHTILTRSPRHAWLEHPRLGAQGGCDSSRRSELGSAAHELLLGGSQAIEWIDAGDYRTKAAQQARDAAIESGRTPMLMRQKAGLEEMAAHARVALGLLCKRLAPGAEPLYEHTMIWQSNLVSTGADGEDDDVRIWCRARPDILVPGAVVDYKTTTNAEPSHWIRSALGSGGYDLGAVHCIDGLHMLATGGEPDPLAPSIYCDGRVEPYWLVQEDSPPYSCTVIGLGPEWQDLAARKLQRAALTWAHCLRAGEDEASWPAYTEQVCWADLPAYEDAAWANREAALRQLLSR